MLERNPMYEEPEVYHAYLLRLWRAQIQGQRQWRASLESPHTGERQSFTNLEQLFAFLRERCDSQAPALEMKDIQKTDTEMGRSGEGVERANYENEI
jgi:hypothetical protein